MGVRSSRCCCPWTRSSSRLCLMTGTFPENSKCPMIRLQLLVMWLSSPMCFLRVPLHHPSQLKRHEGQDGVGSVVQLLSGAKHCIKCGTLLDSTVCAACGSTNPIE